MAEAKRYYWLKLQHDFFTSKRIKKLRRLAGGDTYTIIYLKMQLLAIKNDGVLTYTGIEPTFAEELALDIDEEPENVAVTINFLLTYQLMEEGDKNSYILPYAVENTGSETSAAKRMRELRGQKNVTMLNNVKQCTPMLENCYGEKEIDKEIELDKEKDSDSSSTGAGVAVAAYEAGFGRFPSPMVIADINTYLEKLDADVIAHAIEITVAESIFRWSYTKAILDRYVAANATTIEAAKNADITRKKEVKKKPQHTVADMGSAAERDNVTAALKNMEKIMQRSNQ